MDLGGLVFAIVFLAATLAAVPRAGARMLDRGFAVVDGIAKRRFAPLVLCALIAFVGSMAVSLFVMWPDPRVHDEFSYILAGDTFAHGRLTNPTHPLWKHFESFHIFHEPTYASKYPPAQGAMLAIGILVAGEPIVGVWLSTALMGAAVCWMLRGFVSPRWALLGGIAATLQIGIATAWAQTYWGGAVAAAGGAVALGGAARLARHTKPRDALLLGGGLVVLANSRPFEGAITSLPIAAFLLASLWGDRERLLRGILPLAATLALGLLAMAAYNQVVVGHWWLPPYLHHEQLYAFRPTLSFQSERSSKTVYRYPEMERYYTGKDSPDDPDAVDSAPANAVDALNVEKVRIFFVGRALFLPFVVGLLIALRRADGRMLGASLGLGIATLFLLRYFQIHYIASITGAVFALVAIGLEQLDGWRPAGRRLGSGLCVAALVTCAGGFARDIGRVPNLHTGFGTEYTAQRRARTVQHLLASPGRDVVIVQYGPAHDIHREWVYNAADIDASEIVWARDMGEDGNRELLTYFSDRHSWVLREGFGDDSDGLFPYPGPQPAVAKVP